MAGSDDERTWDMTAIQATDDLAVEDLCRLLVRFDQFHVVPTDLGTRLIAVVGGGQVEGDRLDGSLLPWGGDSLVVGGDDIARMDVRTAVRTHDGATVYLTGLGRIRLDTESRDRFLAGETVTRSGLTGHLALTFETGDASTSWLNATVAIARVEELSQQHIDYRVYALA